MKRAMPKSLTHNLQAALPFDNQFQPDFDNWLGDVSVSNTLKNYSQLPQFTYLFGQLYTGKSHLLSSLAGQLDKHAESFVMFKSSHLLQLDLVAVLSDAVEYVLIDDVDQLAGDQEGERSLFNLFNYCKDKQIKLILSSGIDPQSTAWQLPDLISRLCSGLTLNLLVLRGELAYQCLSQQFRFNGMPVETAVLQYLQTHYNSSFPKLYALFLSLAAESLQQKRKITVPLLKTVIARQRAADS